MRFTGNIFFMFIFLFSILEFNCSQSSSQIIENGKSTVIIDTSGNTIISRFNPPAGFKRTERKEHSFEEYLQNFVLKENGYEVHYYDGRVKPNRNVYVAVLDIDVGTSDLQQCADAVMRLRAEYLYNKKDYSDIAFNFVSDGKPRYFLDYSNQKTDYRSFRKYMNYVFSYANTRSLYNQLNKVDDFKNIQIGDVLIQTGNPYGHAVIVVDMAINEQTGEKVYLLAQSYMPAQEIQILVNPKNKDISPWYKVSNEYNIITPEWRFTQDDLRRF